MQDVAALCETLRKHAERLGIQNTILADNKRKYI